MTERVTWAVPGDAAAVAERIAAAVSRPGAKHIAVPGGSTPGKVWKILTRRALDWSGITLCLTDDRVVPDDHPASNYRALHEALGTLGAKIERLIEGAPVAPFDLVWLGMGEDGHVASLFPHMQAVIRRGATAIATRPIPLPKDAPYERLSLNKTALNATKETILVVTGAAKKAVIEQALAGSDAYPVSDFLRGEGPPVTIYWSK